MFSTERFSGDKANIPNDIAVNNMYKNKRKPFVEFNSEDRNYSQHSNIIFKHVISQFSEILHP